MNPAPSQNASSPSPDLGGARLDYLDATRAFALVLGIVFHASLSFMPIFIGWAVQDISTSIWVAIFVTVSHSFRMETFFLLAGFFGHATFHRKGAREFVRTRVLRIVVPFVVGWFILRPLIVSGWIMGSASLRGDFDFWDGIRQGFQSLATLPTGIFAGSHLWFLYYLAMITGLVLAVRGLATWTGSWHEKIVRRADALLAWLASSRFLFPALVIPTAITLWFMRGWGMDTPDRTLQPHIPVAIIYGGFFVLGWMLHRQRDLISPLARLSPQRWILAGISLGGTVVLSGIQGDPSHRHYIAAHVSFTVGYALMMWSLVFVSIGVFKKFCERPSPFIRYVADSSYWLYLIHLPIVIWLQVAVAELPFHWSLKLAFISTVTIALSLLTYDLFVRSTFIGWVLNGRRRNRALARIREMGGKNSMVGPASVTRSYPAD
jgi:glucans biosynthesis protein C